MAIFEKYQVAFDIARFTMMIHDGVDACKHLANNVEPDTGGTPEPPAGFTGTQLEYLQQRIRSYSNAALTNYAVLMEFINKIGIAEAKASLTAIFGVNADTIQAEILDMHDAAQYIYNNVLSATTLNQLQAGATYISGKVAPWKSLRRRWAI